MNHEKTTQNPMVKFFERLGHRIIQSEHAWWYEVQPKVLLSFPYYKLVNPTENELASLMSEYHLSAIRFPTEVNRYGFMSNIVINTNQEYDFASLHQKARNQTRRALENCTVEQIDFEYLLEHGLPLNRDTADRQGRESQYADANYWKKYCQAAKAVSGMTAWGAFVNGQLACFLISVEVDNWAEWIVNHSSTALRDKYPNNALAFTVGQYYLVKNKFDGVCYGLGSLEPTPDLDHFKVRMGWQLQPIKQRLVFSRNLRCIVSLANETSLNIIGKLFPKSYTVRKTSAMIRFYRQQSFDIPGAIGEQSAKKDDACE
jgi:hypothetical protein